MWSQEDVRVAGGRGLKQDDLWDERGPLRRKQGPEGQLMIAVLQEALCCLEKYRFATGLFERRLFQDARRWVLTEGAPGPFAFELICGTLGLDAHAVRRGLRARAEAQRTGRSAETSTRAQRPTEGMSP